MPQHCWWQGPSINRKSWQSLLSPSYEKVNVKHIYILCADMEMVNTALFQQIATRIFDSSSRQCHMRWQGAILRRPLEGHCVPKVSTRLGMWEKVRRKYFSLSKNRGFVYSNHYDHGTLVFHRKANENEASLVGCCIAVHQLLFPTTPLLCLVFAEFIWLIVEFLLLWNFFVWSTDYNRPNNYIINWRSWF